MSEFKLFNRGFKRTVLFIPGWAADYRIFNSVDIDANYLMPLASSPFDFDKGLLESMDVHGLDKISIIGWSMGGFMGLDLLQKHKEMIDDITLVSVRKRYSEEEIEATRSYLNKNRRAFLRRFYNDCFSGEEREELYAFKTGLMKNYLNEISIDTLLEGLRYLSASRIEPQALAGVKIEFIHGLEDRIAPIKEVLELKDELPDTRLTAIEGAGHIPFLKKNFKEIFCR